MDFKPSNKFILMDRKYYEELKQDIARIRLSITAQEARGLAALVLEKLEKKFEQKNESAVKMAITALDEDMGISHLHEGIETEVKGTTPRGSQSIFRPKGRM